MPQLVSTSARIGPCGIYHHSNTLSPVHCTKQKLILIKRAKELLVSELHFKGITPKRVTEVARESSSSQCVEYEPRPGQYDSC